MPQPTPTPKLFAFDIDGTLLESGHEIALPLQTALQALERMGHHIVLITGRTRVPLKLLQQTRAVARGLACFKLHFPTSLARGLKRER